MKCTKMILGLLALVALTMIDTSVEAANSEYCSLNFTTPEKCLCKAKRKWQDQEDGRSTFNLLKKFCKKGCSATCPSDMRGKTLDELRTLLARENAELKGARNWTIDNVCSAEDRKAIMQLDNYASDCHELTCSLHIIQHEVSLYLMRHHCGCDNSSCEFDADKTTTPDSLPMYTLDTIQGQLIPSIKYSDLGAFLYPHYFHINCVVNTIITKVDLSRSESVCDASN